MAGWMFPPKQLVLSGNNRLLSTAIAMTLFICNKAFIIDYTIKFLQLK